MEWSPHAPPAKEGLEVSADVRTLPHTPPPQEEHMPTKKKKRGACCLNIAASVLLVPAIFAFFRFADEIVGFIAGHVGWMVVGARCCYPVVLPARPPACLQEILMRHCCSPHARACVRGPRVGAYQLASWPSSSPR
jgi:hypothetical protein